MERLTLVVPNSGEIWLLDSDGKPYSLIVEGEDRYDEIKRLSEYEDLEENDRLYKFPCAVGDTVYVIGTCAEVKYILDGTMYDAGGGPGTATGYYCPYVLNEKCPHEDCEECEQYRTKLAVFEDEVEGFGVYDGYTMLYTKKINYCADVENNLGRTIFFAKPDADSAFQKMNESEEG